MSLTLITDSVRPDERAYRLVEIVMTPHAMSKGGRRFRPKTWLGRHRWQILFVNRGDRIAQHITDMGDASLYNFGALQVWSLWEHSVAEVREIAEKVRSNGAWEREIIANAQGESKLTERFLIEQERKRRLATGQVVLSPKGRQ